MNDPVMTDMRSEYSKSLIQVGHDNPNVVVLGADTTDSLKTSGFGKQFPDRFFNVGIAEANLVTMSAGLAVSGKVSFASTYAIFLPGRAVDQIRNNLEAVKNLNFSREEEDKIDRIVAKINLPKSLWAGEV